MRPTDPVAILMVIAIVGIVAGIIFDRLAGPSWLTRQFAGSTRGLVTGALVGFAGSALGYHLAVVFRLRMTWVVLIAATVIGAALILWAWRMMR